ncbi:MAG: hypothetical protein QOJ21_2514, partial [Solirubrobacteraceae bacterium]|nr:hypothetical protein [Solirubrobacteraceae bacterium]
MRRSSMFPLVAALILIGLMAMGGLALAATRTVGVKKAGSRWHFTTTNQSIKKGDTVRWSWSGKVAHNEAGPDFHSKTGTK